MTYGLRPVREDLPFTVPAALRLYARLLVARSVGSSPIAVE